MNKYVKSSFNSHFNFATAILACIKSKPMNNNYLKIIILYHFKVYECGKPWFTLEGFQVVIKAQIEFLIKLGVDSTIKVTIV